MEKVTIGITTYNLERYIREALDSVLAQKTNFEYTILVVDDASTDSTQQILQEYKEKYPAKIKLILKEKNDGSLATSNILFDNIKTEYFCFLDGDDYWISESRLQQAVDFLDKNPTYSMYAGNTIYLRENGLKEEIIKKKYLNKAYSIQDYLHSRCPFIHTSSILTRNIVYKDGIPKAYKDNVNTIYNCAFRGEDIRFIEHLKKGDIYLTDDLFSVYRIHNMGMWQGASKLKQVLESTIASLKRIDYFPEEKDFYQNMFYQSYSKIYSTLVNEKQIDIKYTLSDQEHKLLIGLMNELKSKNIDWNEVKPKKIKKIKYKIMHFIYEKLRKILTKKEII